MTVDQLWGRGPDGTATYVSEVARALAARDDVDLSVLTSHRIGRPSMELPAVPVHHVRTGRRGARPPAPPGVDVVHATTLAALPSAPRAPLVVTVHDLAFLDEPEVDEDLRHALDLVRDGQDVVVVPSAATAAACIDQGVDPDRVRVVHHGVRVPEVSRAEMVAFQESRGLDRPYVLWCGTFAARKNVATLLEAYRVLTAEDPWLDLVLVGPLGWGGAPPEVAEQLERTPPGRVHLLGRLTEADLHRAYAGARVFCFPSTVEGFGLPVLEALAHGVPVVTSAGTPMAELGPSGAVLLADPHAPQDIARAIATAADGRHAELAAGAREQASRFTWERSAAEHVLAYREALGRAAGRSTG